MRLILWFGLSVCFAYGFYWRGLFENGYFVLNAVSYFLLSLFIFIKDGKSFISYLWLSYSINNLLDELFFDPTKVGLNEKIIIIAIPILWLLIKVKTMPERFQNSELYIFLTKIIFPAFLAVGVKLAIEMKMNKSKISMLNIVLSMLIGIGGAYLSSGVILYNCKEEHVPLAIALVAMSSEKIGGWLIFKLNFDTFLTAIFEGFFQYLSNVFNPKK